MTTISVFSGPTILREFRTKAAAEKFARRNKGRDGEREFPLRVVEAANSFFGDYRAGPYYQIVEAVEESKQDVA